MHCHQRRERFAAFPAFPTESLVALRDHTHYQLGLISEFGQLRQLRYRNRHIEEPKPEPGLSGDKQPDAPRAVFATAFWSRITDA
jgi:hypothetical protein